MNYETYPNFKTCLRGTEIDAYCIKVIDGDSVRLCIDCFGGHNFLCRLDGIDTPEKKSHDEDEKCRAYLAENYLKSLIYTKTVRIKCGDFDKYGRLLVRIYSDGIDINKHMIDIGHAVEYHGGTK